MSVGFARPNSSNLVFQLYGRSVHPELFQVYASAHVWQPAYGATIQICDAGHIIAFRRDRTIVTEVTASRQQALPQRKRFLDRRLRGSRDENFLFDGGVRYSASYQLERLDPEVFLTVHEELLKDGRRAALCHRFPATSRLSPEPISLIRTESDPQSLLIHAFHTFPENSVVVRTQSLFELATPEDP